jgi:hypothetical protein
LAAPSPEEVHPIDETEFITPATNNNDLKHDMVVGGKGKRDAKAALAGSGQYATGPP